MITAYFIWVGLLLIAIILYCRKEDKRLDSRAIASEVKGIAIMLVIFGHLSRVAGIELSFINLLGAQGVVLFLISSGYGLFKAYDSKGINIKYWKKRISTVLIPYSIVTAFFIFGDIVVFNKKYSPGYIIKNLTGIDSVTRFDGTMWYIEFIMTWYIAFGLIFYFKKLKDIRIVMLFIISFVFYMQMNRTPFSMYYYQSAVHAFWFPIGILLGRFSQKIKPVIEKQFNTIAMVLISIVLSAAVYPKINYDNNMYMLYNLLVSIVIAGCIIIASNLKTSFKMLTFIGSISYQLYLFEGLFIYNYNIIGSTGPVISFGYYFVIIGALSLSFKKLIEYIYDRLANGNIFVKFRRSSFKTSNDIQA